MIACNSYSICPSFNSKKRDFLSQFNTGTLLQYIGKCYRCFCMYLDILTCSCFETLFLIISNICCMFKWYIRSVLYFIYRYEGLRGFYKGLPAYFLHVTPNICIIFLIYEKLTHASEPETYFTEDDVL